MSDISVNSNDNANLNSKMSHNQNSHEELLSDETSKSNNESKIITKTEKIHKLQNYNNSCWLNTIIQTLWAILSKDNNPMTSNEKDMGSIIYNWLLEMLNKPSETLNLHKQKLMHSPIDFKQSFLICIGKLEEWGCDTQQDAIEALQLFMNNCYSLKQLIHSEEEIFTCPVCNYTKSQVIPETILSIPIDISFIENERLNVEKSLKNMFNIQLKSEATCDKVECKFQLERKLILKNDALNIFVQIVIAKPDNKKDKTKCIISEKIHLKNEATMSSYELIAAITHIGEQVDEGHYVCYKKR